MEKNIKNQNEQQSDRISIENIVNKPIAIDELNMSSKVTPGDIVPGGFTYPNNAIVQNDFLYLRDANGNQIAGRTVSIGDKITVLKIHHDKQLALVQYPAGSVVREGYVTNSTKVIKYLNEYNWVNDSSAEPVYETESSSDGKWGTLSAYEKATKLYKSNNRICVAYDTSKGAHTKSGFVEYEGGSNNSGSNNTNNINPGDIVPGGFTYPNNAVIENDFLYLRDANGNQIAGRTVSVGDKITVLDVGYAKQLALIQYPTSSGVRQGYVTNATNIIRYLDEYNYYNGSTSETVYANSTGSATLGSLNPYECATKLYSKDGRIHIVYDTDKGGHTKSGYVNFAGLDVPVTNITIPDISDPDVTKIEYGKSGKGRPLNVYKIGNGKKALFAGFALHGFEDHWFRDGEALVKIATDLIYKLANYKRTNGDLHGYTVYVAQCMNPDGVIEGRSQNGPGRCAVVSRVDMNRCFPYKFSVNTNSRYYTGSSPLGAIEAVKLRDLILKIRSESTETYVLDFHGWLGFTQGNYDAAKYIANQFGYTHNYTDAGGFFSSWANSLGTDIKGALIEYPKSTANYQSVLNGNYAGKTFNGIINLIKNNAGTGNSNTGNGDQAYNATGKVINVTSTLNVRNQPSTSGTVVGTLKSDQTVTITAKNGSWYKISSPLVGYVHSDYISITNNDNLVIGNSILELISNLTDLSIRYNSMFNIFPSETHYFLSVNHCVVDFLRRYKYSTGLSWTITCGYPQTGFIEYVDSNYSELTEKLKKYIDYEGQNPTIYNHTIDLPHIAATALGYYRNFVPDFWAGWGGDLATSMADITGERRVHPNKSEQEIANHVIGNEYFSISRLDIQGDIDAIWIGRNFTKKRIDILFKEFCNQNLSDIRKSLILNDIGVDENLSLDILKGKIFNKMTGHDGFLHLGGEKLKNLTTYHFVDTINGIVQDIPASTSVQIAACNAFANYILNTKL